MRVLRGLRWEFSPLLITRVISTSRCSSVLSSRLLESVPDPNLSSWIFNWCYANNTPNLYTELFKAPYKPTVPENETWNMGSSKSKNLIIAKIHIKFWFHRLEIEKLWRILDPRIRFCFVNISKFKLNLKVRISERNDKMRQSIKSEAFLSRHKIHILPKVFKFEYLSETVCLSSFRRRWGAGERKYVSLSYNETYYSGGFIRLGAKVNINVAKSRVSSRMMIIFLISLLKYKRNLACNLIILSFLYSDTN